VPANFIIENFIAEASAVQQGPLEKSTSPDRIEYNHHMSTISVQEIQRDPQAFLRRVEAGEPLVVLRDDYPVAEVKPLPMTGDQPRPIGLCKGEFVVPADFDEPLPEEVLKEFEGQ
jgi:antitoxin (DNA-binding transcriptional repressor) of toxin-antitoxin stability system